jgi:hypothetical protein
VNKCVEKLVKNLRERVDWVKGVRAVFIFFFFSSFFDSAKKKIEASVCDDEK